MAYKLKIGPGQGLKLKGNAGFALPLLGGNAIATSKSGGIWTVDLDYSEVQTGSTVNDDTAYVLTWDSASGLFTRLNVTDLKVEFQGTFDGYYQPLDATLTALAALDSTAGILAQTGADTFERRTLTGMANEVTVTNGDGVSGNPTVSLPAALTFTGKTVTGGTFQSPAINTPTGIVKGDVGLGNVDNTSDATKNAAVATLTNKTIDTAGPNTIKVNGNTLAASAGTATVTIPNATDTLVGKATTDTLTNKTISGASNTLSNIGNSSLTNSSMTIAGHSVSLGGSQAIAAADLSNGVTGTGAIVLAASPALTGAPTAPTASPSDNSTKIATTAYVDAQVAGGVAGVASIDGLTGSFTTDDSVSASSNIIRSLQLGHIWGLTLSNNATDATNDIDISAGEATDNSSGIVMTLSSGLTKRLDAAWAVGTGNGGLDTGTIADAGYHVWLIQRSDTGVVDVLFSTSATSPTMPTSYDRKRRIGWIVRASGAIRGFVQNGDKFIFKTPVVIANNYTLTTTSVLFALSVPTGISIEAEFNTLIFGSASVAVVIQTPLISTQTSNSPAGNVNLYNPAGVSAAQKMSMITDTSGQVRAVSNNATGIGFYIIQTGWIDTRGRLN